ncbi:winged helix DNA-binding domain-containing protein [Nocardioides speluncae]|uniref:winged helix DNA-binding domain-containing protein n=1 Tax=Nocardioides speluncae TaxID=2670337 RepID=UPI000D69C1B4|nr:winged helix DNA-binding domain-containing protein [Nocardioides speluncae]
MGTTLTREDVLAFRVRAHQLDRDAGAGTLADTTILDTGVQDTGPDGARWALAIRGVDVTTVTDDDVAMAWTLRGAPHLYRRADLGAVAAAVAPLSDADAGKRIFDASKPLKEAGIGNLEALDAIADAMRKIVTEPLVKGEVSTRLTEAMPEPYRRFCRPCNTIHLYEQTFRLSALRAGLELQPGTSPPVLQPIPGFKPHQRVAKRYDVIRGYLRLLGPATQKQVSEFVDAPVKDIKAHWPEDAVEVTVEGERRWALDLDDGGPAPAVTRLLGPYDLFLQGRDRPLLVPDPDNAKSLWPVIGRPGAVLHEGELVAAWRPRLSHGGRAGKKLRLQIEPWRRLSAATRTSIEEQAERLAAFRGVLLTTVEYDAG